jgi:hypothetical protein
MAISRRLVALTALLAVSPGGGLPASAATSTRSGTFRITLTVVSDSGVPLATNFAAQASVRAHGPLYSQSESVARTIPKTTGSQTVTLIIPYRWTLDEPIARATTVNVSVSASVGAASNTASLSLSAPLPANGATTPVSVTLRL